MRPQRKLTAPRLKHLRPGLRRHLSRFASAPSKKPRAGDGFVKRAASAGKLDREETLCCAEKAAAPGLGAPVAPKLVLAADAGGKTTPAAARRTTKPPWRGALFCRCPTLIGEGRAGRRSRCALPTTAFFVMPISWAISVQVSPRSQSWRSRSSFG
jgi:hypothetical protein